MSRVGRSTQWTRMPWPLITYCLGTSDPGGDRTMGSSGLSHPPSLILGLALVQGSGGQKLPFVLPNNIPFWTLAGPTHGSYP